MSKHDLSVKEFLQRGGRLTHLRDDPKNGGRVVTVAYLDTPEGGYYGATVFRPDHPQDLFSTDVRRANSQTAIDRLFVRGVPVQFPTDKSTIQDFLRTAVYRHGVGVEYPEDPKARLELEEKYKALLTNFLLALY